MKEEDRLAAVVTRISEEVAIFPQGAYLRTPLNQVIRNKSFQGDTTPHAHTHRQTDTLHPTHHTITYTHHHIHTPFMGSVFQAHGLSEVLQQFLITLAKTLLKHIVKHFKNALSTTAQAHYINDRVVSYKMLGSLKTGFL